MYTHFHTFHAIRGLNCVYVLNGAGKGKAQIKAAEFLILNAKFLILNAEFLVLNAKFLISSAKAGKAAERGVEGGIAPRKLVPTVRFQWKNPGFRIEES